MLPLTRQEELRTVNDPTLAIETPVGKPLLPTLSGGTDRFVCLYPLLRFCLPLPLPLLLPVSVRMRVCAHACAYLLSICTP